MTLHDLARRLLAKAREDEVVVDKLILDPEVSPEVLGFHCQQSAEKLLKAVLSENGIGYPRTHDLAFLHKLLDEHDLASPVELSYLEKLTPFAVELRYDLLDEIGPPLDLGELREAVNQLRGWAESRIGGS